MSEFRHIVCPHCDSVNRIPVAKPARHAKCGMCHNKIAPKIGDKAAWAPRIKKGTGVMVANTVKGIGKMPPQVGKTGLTEAQVKAAVEHLVSRSK